eukprot:COSAG05_NODE_15103_length_378_cov_1.100358_1_plen_125_part_11
MLRRPAAMSLLLSVSVLFAALRQVERAGTEAQDPAQLQRPPAAVSTAASGSAVSTLPVFTSTLACRRQVRAAVAVVDDPPTFSFPAYGRTVCYQPTTDVLQQMGWQHAPEVALQATLVSRLSDPG